MYVWHKFWGRKTWNVVGEFIKTYRLAHFVLPGLQDRVRVGRHAEERTVGLGLAERRVDRDVLVALLAVLEHRERNPTKSLRCFRWRRRSSKLSPSELQTE